MSKFAPFLLFDGTCAQAMWFYKSCFGGDPTLTTAADSPMKSQFPPEKQNRVLHAHLKGGPIEITAADWMHPIRTPKQGNNVCLIINAAPYLERKTYFESLSEVANSALLDKLIDMPFGSYGHLCDKFGVHRFCQCEKSTQ